MARAWDGPPLSELGRRVWEHIRVTRWRPVFHCDLAGFQSPAAPEAARSSRLWTAEGHAPAGWWAPRPTEGSGSRSSDTFSDDGNDPRTPSEDFFRMGSGWASDNQSASSSWHPPASTGASIWSEAPVGAGGWHQTSLGTSERPDPRRVGRAAGWSGGIRDTPLYRPEHPPRTSTPSASAELAEDIIQASQQQLRRSVPRLQSSASPEQPSDDAATGRAAWDQLVRRASPVVRRSASRSSPCPLAVSTPATSTSNATAPTKPNISSEETTPARARGRSPARDKPVFSLMSPSLMGSPLNTGGPQGAEYASELQNQLPEEDLPASEQPTHQHSDTSSSTRSADMAQSADQADNPFTCEPPVDVSVAVDVPNMTCASVGETISTAGAPEDTCFPGLSQNTTNSYYIAVPESQTAAMIGMLGGETSKGARDDGDEASLSQSTICGEVTRLIDSALASPKRRQRSQPALRFVTDDPPEKRASGGVLPDQSIVDDDDPPIFRASKGRKQTSPAARRFSDQSDERFGRLAAAVTRASPTEVTSKSATSPSQRHKHPGSPKAPPRQQKRDEGGASEQDDAKLMGPPLHPVFRKRRVWKAPRPGHSGGDPPAKNKESTDSKSDPTRVPNTDTVASRSDGKQVAPHQTQPLRDVANIASDVTSTGKRSTSGLSDSTTKRQRSHAPLLAPAPGDPLVTTLSSEDTSAVVAALSDGTVACVSLCVEHEDGGSQLRPASGGPQRREPAALVAAVSGGPLCGRLLRVTPAALAEADLTALTAALLAGPGRRTCFSARQIMLWALRRCRLPPTAAVSSWRLRDLSVAGWLLSPDEPPATFTALLHSLSRSSARDASLSRHHQLAADIGQLETADTELTRRLAECGLLRLYETVEVPLAALLAVMEARGLRVDVSRLHQSASACQRRARWLESAAHRAAGTVFSLQSPVQLRRLLYDQLKLDLQAGATVPLTDGGLKSTSEQALLILTEAHPLPNLLLQHRRIQKLKSTYVDGILAQVRGGAVYPHWLQTAAATGRVQAAAPNLQSVPRRPVSLLDDTTTSSSVDADQKAILARAPFVARPGHVLLAADFCQMELRLLAHLSRDSRLTEAIRSAPGGDIFRQLAAVWADTPAESVSLEQRERTKRVVYAAMYGAGRHKLAQVLECSAEQAQTVLDTFLSRCPAISGFSRAVVAAARRDGYVTSLLGRRRYVPAVTDHRPQVRCQAERQAVNFCVQGSAADVCKLTMLAVVAAAPDVPLVAQLHDELLWEVPTQKVTGFCRLITQQVDRLDELLTAAGQPEKLLVPLPVAISVSECWASMETLTDATAGENSGGCQH